MAKKAMLVSLNIKLWRGYKRDKRATAEILAEKHAAHGTAAVNKRLFREAPQFKAVQKIANRVRVWHYEQTLPWTADGMQVLPAANFFSYANKMVEFKEEFGLAVAEFIRAYPTLVEADRDRLGRLFNPADYPSPQKVESLFHLGFKVMPFPDAEDFRLELGGNEARIKEEIRADIEAGINAAVRDLYRRLYEAVAHMAERLKDEDAIFRDSLTRNLDELTDLLPRLNITGDKTLAKMIEETKRTLSGLDPEGLRKDKAHRAETARKAEAIASKMAGFMGV